MLANPCRTRLLLLALAAHVCLAQQPSGLHDGMQETGQTTVGARTVSYMIHRLPISSFPDLPSAVAQELDRRGCMIPQTYEAHHPENVVHASLERANSSDWAVLCSVHGTVTLLVFFGNSAGKPTELAQSLETRRLQRHDSSGVYGFNWGIDPADPATIHNSVTGPDRPPLLNYDGLADSVVDRSTLYRVFLNHAWTVVTPDP